jgi:hypothetical protein
MEDVGILIPFLFTFWPNNIFNGHLIHFVVMWYIFPRFGMLYREKSGNPGHKSRRVLCG